MSSDNYSDNANVSPPPKGCFETTSELICFCSKYFSLQNTGFRNTWQTDGPRDDSYVDGGKQDRDMPFSLVCYAFSALLFFLAHYINLCLRLSTAVSLSLKRRLRIQAGHSSRKYRKQFGIQLHIFKHQPCARRSAVQIPVRAEDFPFSTLVQIGRKARTLTIQWVPDSFLGGKAGRAWRLPLTTYWRG